MAPLLYISRLIDGVNTVLGRAASWLVLVAVLVSAGNAISRKFFSMSSNAWLEMQWYLFGAVFMLGASWVLKLNQHVRIDVLTSRLSERWRNYIDLVGHVLFLLPFVLVHLYFAMPKFLSTWHSGEVSMNAGGLPIWPAKAFIAIGFLMLLAQAISEIIKRVAVILNHSERQSA